MGGKKYLISWLKKKKSPIGLICLILQVTVKGLYKVKFVNQPSASINCVYSVKTMPTIPKSIIRHFYYLATHFLI